MPKESAEPTRPSEDPSPLVDALDKNRQATTEVKRVADDLAVVHAVLDTKVAHSESEADVTRAVAETNRLEKRLVRSAEKLEQVNETLQRETQRAP